jgi:pimeloyl-ACP methyl ester carboxylesterase
MKEDKLQTALFTPPLAAICLAGACCLIAAGCGDDGTNARLDAAAGDDSDVSPDSGVDAALHDSQLPDGGQQTSTDPDTEGPHEVSVREETLARSGREIPVAAHVPDIGGQQPIPAIIFIPGFQLDSWRYEPLCTHLASHGFVVVRADPPDPMMGVDHVEMAADVSAVVDWVVGADSGLADIVDGEQIGGMGHSLGGKVTAMTAYRDTRIKALFGIDPVNGGNGPLGYDESHPDIVPDEVTPLTIPVGFAGETTNATGGGFGSEACAPEDQNFVTFYEAATNASWRAMWLFVGADHMDFVDDTSSCYACTLCEEGTADPQAVRSACRTLAAAFFRLHLADQTSMESWLAGSNLPPEVEATQP